MADCGFNNQLLGVSCCGLNRMAYSGPFKLIGNVDLRREQSWCGWLSKRELRIRKQSGL